ncbi:MAG: pilus assembly protein PilO [Desulfobacterales bacterium]|nr:MAG: pilus assembly protein PilO [Desulfobacterales bacterium]
MKKSNSKITAFIDDKYIPLDKKLKITIGVLLMIIPIALFFFFFFKPSEETITALENKRNQLQREIKNLRQKERNKPKLLAQVAEIEEEFETAAQMLPKDKEIPKLLTDISALGRNAGLDFLTFIPGADIPKDFYSEIPVNINVRGPYHSMGFFFDQVSKLDRIVTVSNVTLSNPNKVQGEMLLNSQCRLVTYRFTNKKLPKQKK